MTNLGALLLAKQLGAFSSSLARKAPRLRVVYDGNNKLLTHQGGGMDGARGYAVGFEGLVDFVHAAPQNRFLEVVVRDEVKMFPKQALRELIANALVHQTFSLHWRVGNDRNVWRSIRDLQSSRTADVGVKRLSLTSIGLVMNGLPIYSTAIWHVRGERQQHQRLCPRGFQRRHRLTDSEH